MRNKNRPFFYDDRKKKWPWGITLLILIIVAGIWGSRVPAIRQALGQPVIDSLSYGKSLIQPVATVDPLKYRIQTFYPTIELPSEEVLFAENLEDISNEELLPESIVSMTPTPGVLWVIKATEGPLQSGQTIHSEEISHNISMPAFELQDYLNDGATALSTVLRFYGKNENQYLVSMNLKPDYLDPNISMDEMKKATELKYPDLQAISRINCDEALMTTLIQSDIPVIIRMQFQRTQPAWKGDDLWDARYVVLSGVDLVNRLFFYTDPKLGDQKEISFSELMENWYPFKREALIIFPQSELENIQLLLGNSWDESENLRMALEKFRLDISMVPDNCYAWLNAGAVLSAENIPEESWNSYRTALQIGIPQRFLLYDFGLYEAAFQSGAADELKSRSDAMIKINSHSEENWLWNGWASMLTQEREKAEQSFRKAQNINPESDAVRYALEYIKQY